MQELQGSKEEEKTTCVAALVNRSHSTKPTSPAHRIPIPPPPPPALGMKIWPAAGAQEPGLFPNKGMQVISDPPWKCIPQGNSPSSHSWQFPLWLLARPPAFETPWDFAWVSVLLILPRRNPRPFWTSSLFARTAARTAPLLHVSTGGTAKPVYFQKARGALLSS